MVIVFLFIIGICVGSFLNVLADRLPKGEDVIKGRSHCDYCKHTLQWFELIPLVSFLLQKGKTRCCRKHLSLQYPLSELLCGIGFVFLYYSSSSLLMYIISLCIFSSFFVIFIADLKYEVIPMEMIIIGFLSALVFHAIPSIRLGPLLPFMYSAFGAGLFFFGIWVLTKGKAMGDGDIYLASLLGFLLGFPQIIISLYAAFLTGALVGVILICSRKKSLKAHIPFGPFLILGYGITLLWGEKILEIWRLLW